MIKFKAHLSALWYTCSTPIYTIIAIVVGIIWSTSVGYGIVHLFPNVTFRRVFFEGFKYTALGVSATVCLFIIGTVIYAIHDEIGLKKFTINALMLLSSALLVGFGIVSVCHLETSHIMLKRYSEELMLGMVTYMGIVIVYGIANWSILLFKTLRYNFKRCKQKYADRLDYIMRTRY